MKYFLDTEFIEGFHKPLFGKKRHFIDLISIGLVREDGLTYYAISTDFNGKDADSWVYANVIAQLPDRPNADPFQHHAQRYWRSNETIKRDMLTFFGCWRDQLFYRAPEGIEIYGYYSDYDWVLFCSLFGRMIDLPKGFPMYCIDLKQTLDEKVRSGLFPQPHRPQDFDDALEMFKAQRNYPKQEDEHNALSDAKWNRRLYDFLSNQ